MHAHNSTWQRVTGELFHFIMTFKTAVFVLLCTGMKNKIKSFYSTDHSARLPKLFLLSNPLIKTMTSEKFWLLSCSILQQLLKLILLYSGMETKSSDFYCKIEFYWHTFLAWEGWVLIRLSLLLRRPILDHNLSDSILSKSIHFHKNVTFNYMFPQETKRLP